MGTLTIRNVEDDLKRDLRIRAAELGKSMEEEARSIIRVVVREGLSLNDLEGRKIRQGGSAWDIVARLREEYGTFELEVPERRDVAPTISIFDDLQD